MGKIYIIILVCILGGSFTSAHAENASSSYSLTATTGGYTFSSGHATPEPVYGLKLGYDITGRGMADSIGVEGVFNVINWTDRGNAYLFRLDVIVPVTPRKRLVPLLAVGPGGISGNGETSFVLSFGGGVKYLVSDNLALRGDLRDMVVYGLKATENNVEYTVGLSWFFGKKEWPMEDLERRNVAASEGALPSASTTQGQAMGRDRNAAESAAQKPVAAEAGKAGGNPVAPSPADSTKGAKTGEKTDVAAAGKEGGAATAASSGAIPQEAEHPEGGSAGPKQPLPAACRELTSDLHQDRSLLEVTIGFALYKADISPRYLRRLENVVKFMLQNRGTTAVISGHTDSTGPFRYNIDLSQRRAESVKKYLIKLGIAPSRLITRGSGPCTPVAGNLTHAGMQKNRRVTTVVTFINYN